MGLGIALIEPIPMGHGMRGEEPHPVTAEKV